ncbi:MAG: hypothetical protein ABJB74_00645 [Gemmatimonas sp.]
MIRPLWVFGILAHLCFPGPSALQAAPAHAMQQTSIIGCYRADRPLGTAASADGVPGAIGREIGEQGDALLALATFQLLANGRVDRRGTVAQSWWARGSHWELARDTLHVTLSTRTSGWALHLRRSPAAGDSVYVGVAHYLSDVVVKDTTAWKPPRVLVRVRRETCANPA